MRKSNLEISNSFDLTTTTACGERVLRENQHGENQHESDKS